LRCQNGFHRLAALQHLPHTSFRYTTTAPFPIKVHFSCRVQKMMHSQLGEPRATAHGPGFRESHANARTFDSRRSYRPTDVGRTQARFRAGSRTNSSGQFCEISHYSGCKRDRPGMVCSPCFVQKDPGLPSLRSLGGAIQRTQNDQACLTVCASQRPSQGIMWKANASSRES
jgi:hypothetical protein